MSYRIKRKWTDFDSGYVSRWGEEGARFDSETFPSKEAAKRSLRSRVWKLDGISSDFEITGR